MPKKLIALALCLLIILSTSIPIFACNEKISYTVEGNRVTISWDGSLDKTIVIKRDNVEYKQLNGYKKGTYQIDETVAGSHKYSADYSSNLYNGTTGDFTVVGSGKPSIKLEYKNNYGIVSSGTKNERIYNWFRILNIGTTPLDYNKIKVRYFYTIDGEPKSASPNPDNGQIKTELSDARMNPIVDEINASKDVLIDTQNVKMHFVKVNPPLINVDYYCDTYYTGVTGKSLLNGYYVKMQPAFKKNNMTNEEMNSGMTYIRDYDITNDYSFDGKAYDYKENKNICVYYDDELIWGNDPMALQAPRNLSATTTISSVSLKWDSVNYTTGYKVYKVVDGVTSAAINCSSPNYIDTNVIPGKTYSYYVTSVKDGSESDKSNIIDATVPTNVPTNLTATPDGNRIRLSWTAPAAAPQSYNILRSESSNGTFTDINTGITGTTYVDNSIPVPTSLSGKTYYYKVVANFNGSLSAPSNIASATVIPNLPNPPSNLQAVVNGNNIVLTWDSVTGATSYKVYRVLNGVTGAAINCTTNNYTDTSVERGRTYTYYVTAVKDGLESNKSGPADISVPTNAPSQLKATFQVDCIKLEWQPAQGAQSYTLLKSESYGGTYTTVKSGIVGTSTTDSAVINVDDSDSKTYYYKVVALFNGVQSEPSNIAPVLVHRTIVTEFGQLRFSIKSKMSSSNTGFVSGSYVPVVLEIKLNKDVNNLSFYIDQALSNATEGSPFKAIFVSTITPSAIVNGVTTTASSITGVTGSSIVVQNSSGKNQFKANDIIVVEFAVKISPTADALKENNVSTKYDKQYNMGLTINATGFSPIKKDSSGNPLELKLLILNPNKLK